MSVEDVQFNVQWIKGRLSFVALHGAETLASSFVDPTDEESIAKLVVDVSSANGFTDAERDRLAQDVELAIRAEAKNAPEPEPDIIPLNAPPPTPPFPLHTLPDWLRESIVHVSRSVHGAAPEIAAGVSIAVIASILQRAYYIDVTASWRNEPACLWVFVIARASAGKTPIFNYFTDPATDFIADRVAEMRVAMQQHESKKRILEARRDKIEKELARGSKEDGALALEYELRETIEEMEGLTPPASPAQIIADCTKEGFRAKVEETQGYAAVWDDEGVMTNNTIGGRYGNAGANGDDTDTFRKAFNGSRIITNRSGSKYSYDGRCHLSILQAVQPHVLETVRDSGSAMERGTFARYLIFWPSVDNIGKRTFDSPPVPEDVEAQYRNHITRLMQHCEEIHASGNHRVLTISPEADRMRTELNREFEASREHAESALVESDGKLFGACLVRIAMLLHVVWGEKGGVVSAETMERACEIIRVLRSHTARALGAMATPPSTKDAKVVLDAIRKHAGQDLRESHVTKSMRCNRNWSPDRTRDAISVLEKHNYLRREKRGRQSVVLVMHSRIWEDE